LGRLDTIAPRRHQKEPFIRVCPLFPSCQNNAQLSSPCRQNARYHSLRLRLTNLMATSSSGRMFHSNTITSGIADCLQPRCSRHLLWFADIGLCFYFRLQRCFWLPGPIFAPPLEIYLGGTEAGGWMAWLLWSAQYESCPGYTGLLSAQSSPLCFPPCGYPRGNRA
jgi:hypothetical protein